MRGTWSRPSPPGRTETCAAWQARPCSWSPGTRSTICPPSTAACRCPAHTKASSGSGASTLFASLSRFRWSRRGGDGRESNPPREANRCSGFEVRGWSCCRVLSGVLDGGGGGDGVLGPMRCPSIDGGSRPQPTPPEVEGDGPQPPPAACRAPESGVGCQRPRHGHAAALWYSWMSFHDRAGRPRRGKWGDVGLTSWRTGAARPCIVGATTYPAREALWRVRVPDTPFSSTGPISANVTGVPWAASTTSWLTSTSLGLAYSAILAEMFTVRPK
jgi:hypothetical protein